MPVIEFKAKEGKGWTPLPKGTYILEIVSVDPTKVSKAQNPQMMLEANVAEGDHTGKKCTLWYPLDGGAAWRLRNLLEGTGIDHEQIESGEVAEDGSPIHGYKFDTDDLVGARFMCDVTQREYNGSINNDFLNERSTDGEEATDTKAAKPAAAAKAAAPAPARTPTAAASGVARRPRV